MNKLFSRIYKNWGRHEQFDESSVAELHWPDGRVVQISGATEEDSRGAHVLIRVWPENGTAENGGKNITDFSIVLRPNGEHWSVESLHIDGRYLDHYKTAADEKPVHTNCDPGDESDSA